MDLALVRPVDAAHAASAEHRSSDAPVVAVLSPNHSRSGGYAGLVSPPHRLQSMVSRADVVHSWRSAAELVGIEPPSDDDVPVTIDGRRLDTPEKVVAYLEEINAKRATAKRVAPY
jgi:hypothetical protein